MSQQGYLTIGVLVVGAAGWLLKWWLSKSLDARFEKREQEEREFRREQIEDAIRQQQGQQVMSSSLQVILRHMITGDHIEDLEKAQAQLEEFTKENNASLLRKAAKYNMNLR